MYLYCIVKMQHPSTKSILSHTVVKPIAAGAIASALELYLMKNTNLTSVGYFGLAVAGGVCVASAAGQGISPFFPTHTPIGALGKNLEARIVEITFGSASAYLVNAYILKNEYNTNNLLYKLAIVSAADIGAELVCELVCMA